MAGPRAEHTCFANTTTVFQGAGRFLSCKKLTAAEDPVGGMAFGGDGGFQMGAPIFMNKGDIQVALNRDVLEEFKRRLGAPSPTMQDAMRFLQLSSSIQGVLTPPDVQAFEGAIRFLKDQPQIPADDRKMAETVIDIIEAKILGATDKDKDKVKKWQEQKGHSVLGLRKLAAGQPVRLASCTSRHGVIEVAWTFNTGSGEDSVIVRFDTPAGSPSEWVQRDLIVTVCACGCGQDAPALRCAGCRSCFYRDADCQKSHWGAHKPRCKEMRKEQ